MACPEQSGKSIRYQILIRGKLDPKWSQWFAGFLITHTNGETVLEGEVSHQAALHGILVKINELGLNIISAEKITPCEKGE